MNCMNCDDNKNIEIFNNCFVCNSCKETNNVVSCMCKTCGKVWGVNDLSKQPTNCVEVNKTVCSTPLMSDYIHKCLMCNAMSYEKKENLWCCHECGFEWEVTACV